MNVAKSILLVGLVGALSAEPLQVYEAIGEGVTAEMRLKIEALLCQGQGEARKRISKISILDDANISACFPDGRFFRASVVISYSVSNHAALLEYVVFSSGGAEVALPMAGERSEFVELLKSVSFRLDDSAKAEKLAKAYAAIYRLNPVGEPKVKRGENEFLFHFDLPQDSKGRKPSISVSLAYDKEKKVTKVTGKQVMAEPK